MPRAVASIGVSGESVGQYPQPKLPDKVQQVAKAAVAAIPLVGGSAAELLDLVITPAVQKHQAIWLNELADVVDTLRDRGVDVAALADDEGFATAVLHASRIALGTHLEGKIRRLKSCLVTMALAPERDDFIAMRFIGFVDELSDEHFVVITYARDPIAWFERHGIERQHYLSASRRQA